jgi:hypothetical protein
MDRNSFWSTHLTQISINPIYLFLIATLDKKLKGMEHYTVVILNSPKQVKPRADWFFFHFKSFITIEADTNRFDEKSAYSKKNPELDSTFKVFRNNSISIRATWLGCLINICWRRTVDEIQKNKGWAFRKGVPSFLPPFNLRRGRVKNKGAAIV